MFNNYIISGEKGQELGTHQESHSEKLFKNTIKLLPASKNKPDIASHSMSCNTE
jgi:hypothetical protein